MSGPRQSNAGWGGNYAFCISIVFEWECIYLHHLLLFPVLTYTMGKEQNLLCGTVELRRMLIPSLRCPDSLLPITTQCQNSCIDRRFRLVQLGTPWHSSDIRQV